MTSFNISAHPAKGWSYTRVKAITMNAIKQLIGTYADYYFNN